MELKLAGVTFNNDAEDGGESRQAILRELRKSGRRIVDLDLIYTTFDGEPAIKVRERSTKKIVGWIQKTMVADVMARKIKHTIGFISDWNDIECVKITKPERPTNVEYHRMKAMAGKIGMIMPAYDKRAYKVWERTFWKQAA